MLDWEEIKALADEYGFEPDDRGVVAGGPVSECTFVDQNDLPLDLILHIKRISNSKTGTYAVWSVVEPADEIYHNDPYIKEEDTDRLRQAIERATEFRAQIKESEPMIEALQDRFDEFNWGYVWETGKITFVGSDDRLSVTVEPFSLHKGILVNMVLHRSDVRSFYTTSIETDDVVEAVVDARLEMAEKMRKDASFLLPQGEGESLSERVSKQIERTRRLQDKLMNNDYVYRFKREGPGHRTLVVEKLDDDENDDDQ